MTFCSYFRHAFTFLFAFSSTDIYAATVRHAAKSAAYFEGAFKTE